MIEAGFRKKRITSANKVRRLLRKCNEAELRALIDEIRNLLAPN
jgi:hypothetical protein